MTYNIHRWTGQDQCLDTRRLAQVIRAGRADVVGLNEVLYPITDGRGRVEPLEELADRLGMYWTFGPSGWIDRGPAWEGAVGNALLSRYPLANVSNVHLPRAPGFKRRSLLSASLAGGPARGLVAHVTHLDHVFEVTRLLQLEGILNRITQSGPHFLAGDFNTPGFLGLRTRKLLPPVLRRMRHAGYDDAFHVVGAGSGHTFPAQAPWMRLDFLFMPRQWAHGLRMARTLDLSLSEQASDHRPLLVEWGWPDPGHDRLRDGDGAPPRSSWAWAGWSRLVRPRRSLAPDTTQHAS